MSGKESDAYANLIDVALKATARLKDNHPLKKVAFEKVMDCLIYGAQAKEARYLAKQAAGLPAWGAKGKGNE